MEKISQVIILFGVTRGIINQLRRQRNTQDRTVEELASQTLVTVGQNIFNGEELGNGGPRNPKIQALVDEIINDGQDMDMTSLPSFAAEFITCMTKPSGEVIAEVFPSELPTTII